jgi:putative toxin-antitoxin system antitoxin component (TIGR02293 family)
MHSLVMASKATEAIFIKAALVLGSRDEAERWMSKPAIGLNRQRPIDLLTTAAGRRLVSTYLDQIEHGVYV